MIPGIPAHAECLDDCNLYETTRVPSLYAPGMLALKHILKCPGCSRRHPNASVCRAFKCDCGLMLRIEIGCVYCWRPLPTAEAAE